MKGESKSTQSCSVSCTYSNTCGCMRGRRSCQGEEGPAHQAGRHHAPMLLSTRLGHYYYWTSGTPFVSRASLVGQMAPKRRQAESASSKASPAAKRQAKPVDGHATAEGVAADNEQPSTSYAHFDAYLMKSVGGSLWPQACRSRCGHAGQACCSQHGVSMVQISSCQASYATPGHHVPCHHACRSLRSSALTRSLQSRMAQATGMACATRRCAAEAAAACATDCPRGSCIVCTCSATQVEHSVGHAAPVLRS